MQRTQNSLTLPHPDGLDIISILLHDYFQSIQVWRRAASTHLFHSFFQFARHKIRRCNKYIYGKEYEWYHNHFVGPIYLYLTVFELYCDRFSLCKSAKTFASRTAQGMSQIFLQKARLEVIGESNRFLHLPLFRKLALWQWPVVLISSASLFNLCAFSCLQYCLSGWKICQVIRIQLPHKQCWSTP